jgi:hypothetical protein
LPVPVGGSWVDVTSGTFPTAGNGLRRDEPLDRYQSRVLRLTGDDPFVARVDLARVLLSLLARRFQTMNPVYLGLVSTSRTDEWVQCPTARLGSTGAGGG